MKRILFITPYPEGVAPSQRLKFEQYYPALVNAGFEVNTDSFIDREFWSFIYLEGMWMRKIVKTIHAYGRRLLLLLRLGRYDVIYIHLWYTPYGPPIFERIVTTIHSKVIYDIDDMVFLGHSSSANRLLMFLKGKNKMISLMKKSSHVITCTPHLDAFVKRYNPKTGKKAPNSMRYDPKTGHVVPNSVSPNTNTIKNNKQNNKGGSKKISRTKFKKKSLKSKQ